MGDDLADTVHRTEAAVTRFRADPDALAWRDPLLLAESAASSRIEDIPSGTRAIAVALIGEPPTPNTARIAANVRLTRAAHDLPDALTPDAVLGLHRTLLGEYEPGIAGRLREQQVWIGGSRVGPHLAAFVPPHHTRVPAAIDDLLAFGRRGDVPPLVKAAVAHAQFETVHPFLDGNGRTGRAIVHAMLRGSGPVPAVPVPVSAGLLSDVDGYVGALTAYRDSDPARVVECLAAAVHEGIANAGRLLGDLRAIRERWTGAVAACEDAVVWRLMELLLRQPVASVETAVRELDAGETIAHRAFERLTGLGLLSEFSGRKRNRLWQAREVIDALDEFARRAGRRGLARQD